MVSMFEPLTEDEINNIPEPISAEDIFKKFLDKNRVYEDYLLAIKFNTIREDDKSTRIEDITRSKKIMDWIMVINWSQTPLGKGMYEQTMNENYPFRSWGKLNTAWADTVRLFDSIKAATNRSENV